MLMPWIQRLSLVMACAAALAAVAQAADPRCSAPPYGGSPDKYRAFVNTYGKALDDPGRILAEMCEIKFGGADRAALYKLGITDAQIDAKATSDLAAAAVDASKKK
jgi:hypothetical protein